MIANELQRRVTQTAIREFEEALARLDEDAKDRPAGSARGSARGWRASWPTCARSCASTRRSAPARCACWSSTRSLKLPEALIRARIAAGLSQKELAGRLGLKEQQIQRYEARRYAGASLDRIQAVADALGMQIHERVVLPTGPSGSTEPGGEAAPTTTTGSPAARET